MADGHGRVRRADRDLPGRHAHRRAEGAGDGADRGARAGAPQRLRRRGRLPRRGRRSRHGDRDPHRGDARRAWRTCRPRPASSPTASRRTRSRRRRNKARAVLQAIATAETLRTRARETRVRVALRRSRCCSTWSARPARCWSSLRTWQTVHDAAPGPAARRRAATLTGRTVDAAPTALALVALAGVVAVLATRGPARRVVGAVLALAGVGLVWRALASAGAVSTARARALVTDRHRTVDAGAASCRTSSCTRRGRSLSAVCGVLVLAAGAADRAGAGTAGRSCRRATRRRRGDARTSDERARGDHAVDRAGPRRGPTRLRPGPDLAASTALGLSTPACNIDGRPIRWRACWTRSSPASARTSRPARPLLPLDDVKAVAAAARPALDALAALRAPGRRRHRRGQAAQPVEGCARRDRRPGRAGRRSTRPAARG